MLLRLNARLCSLPKLLESSSGAGARGEQRGGRRGKSYLGPAACTEALLGVCASAEGQRLAQVWLGFAA